MTSSRQKAPAISPGTMYCAAHVRGASLPTWGWRSWGGRGSTKERRHVMAGPDPGVLPGRGLR
jgi:hypothetical protein